MKKLSLISLGLFLLLGVLVASCNKEDHTQVSPNTSMKIEKSEKQIAYLQNLQQKIETLKAQESTCDNNWIQANFQSTINDQEAWGVGHNNSLRNARDYVNEHEIEEPANDDEFAAIFLAANPDVSGVSEAQLSSFIQSCRTAKADYSTFHQNRVAAGSISEFLSDLILTVNELIQVTNYCTVIDVVNTIDSDLAADPTLLTSEERDKFYRYSSITRHSAANWSQDYEDGYDYMQGRVNNPFAWIDELQWDAIGMDVWDCCASWGSHGHLFVGAVSAGGPGTFWF